MFVSKKEQKGAKTQKNTHKNPQGDKNLPGVTSL